MGKSVESVDLVNTTQQYFPAATSAHASSRIIHTAGRIGIAKDGRVPVDYESEVHLALHNLHKVILTSRADIEDIAKIVIYVVNYDPNQRKHTRHVQRFLRGHRPAITLVPVQQLAVPSWLIEIEAVVLREQKQISIPRALKDTARPQEIDVVVIGAGLAGLSAARQLVRASLDVVVLEARDRVGGKTWSQPLSAGKGIAEFGAAWINDVSQSKMIGLAREFGLELIEQNTRGDCVFQGFDGKASRFAYGELPGFDEATAKDVARIRDLCEADCQKLDVLKPRDAELDSLTFEAYLRKNNASRSAIATATVWTRAMLGLDPADLSALFFLNYCKSGGGLLQMRSDRKGGGQHLRVRQGTQSFSSGLASTLPPGTVRLSTPVSKVVQHETRHVDVVYGGGNVYRARKVITTIPSPALRSINFVPELNLAKQVWCGAAVGGFYVKAIVVFKTAFWLEQGLCGLTQSFVGPASVIRDTSSPADDKHALTCFMVGPPGAEWAAKGVEVRKKILLDQIATVYDAKDKVASEFEQLISHDWANDHWAGNTCPTTGLTPGLLHSVGSASFREPLGNLYFAGTETAGEWKGYMEGAVRSGERAAKEVTDGFASGLGSRL
ncbi:flavin containing amine oxidoreductase [Fusarium albosuccineum]|uniref:Amine oxidase n=1 Tax=Fusarium albosuccineum TaxID=1237068 RepID=A0A8H4P333_9HYPO|nr:flavin containing amine oxidoreductase [Fusarium albosuccineum]